MVTCAKISPKMVNPRDMAVKAEEEASLACQVAGSKPGQFISNNLLFVFVVICFHF